PTTTAPAPAARPTSCSAPTPASCSALTSSHSATTSASARGCNTSPPIPTSAGCTSSTSAASSTAPSSASTSPAGPSRTTPASPARPTPHHAGFGGQGWTRAPTGPAIGDEHDDLGRGHFFRGGARSGNQVSVSVDLFGPSEPQHVLEDTLADSYTGTMELWRG